MSAPSAFAPTASAPSVSGPAVAVAVALANWVRVMTVQVMSSPCGVQVSNCALLRSATVAARRHPSWPLMCAWAAAVAARSAASCALWVFAMWLMIVAAAMASAVSAAAALALRMVA